MLSDATFKTKLSALLLTMKQVRDLSEPEALALTREYQRALDDLHESDFIEACDRILYLDDWFPTIARLREVAATCLKERMARYDAEQRRESARLGGLVCATCHGARWVRLGGYSPVKVQAGEPEARAIACPTCTTDGRYDAFKERSAIQRHNGVPNPQLDRQPDPEQNTWRVPRTIEGRVDLDELYRQSRILRGLDPTVDERPQPVSGWGTVARARSLEEVPA